MVKQVSCSYTCSVGILLYRNSKIPGPEGTYWISMMSKRRISHTQSLFTHVNWRKTEKEESETEGPAHEENIGLRHRWSSRMQRRVVKGEREREVMTD